jgi:hypothetical protein
MRAYYTEKTVVSIYCVQLGEGARDTANDYWDHIPAMTPR